VQRCRRDDGGKLLGVRPTNLDVTQRVRYEQELQRLADYDPLTDLPNRRFAHERSRNWLPTAAAGSPFAVMFLDLDVSRTSTTPMATPSATSCCAPGRAHGAMLLRTRLLCRFGGDEFVIVVPGVAHPEVPRTTPGGPGNESSGPSWCCGQRFFISGPAWASAPLSRRQRKAEVLIRNADLAMYRAQAGRARSIGFYSRGTGGEHRGIT